MKNNQVVSYALGILFSFCLIVTLLITSVEAVTYWTPGYYEREYSKYNVTEDVHMEMDDLFRCDEGNDGVPAGQPGRLTRSDHRGRTAQGIFQ